MSANVLCGSPALREDEIGHYVPLSARMM
jgi:hypothetical protein